MIQTLPDSTKSVTVAETAAQILKKYELVDDLFTPTIEELLTLYSRLGIVQQHRTIKTCFALTLDCGKVVVFRNRQQAWSYYRLNKQLLEHVASQRPCPF